MQNCGIALGEENKYYFCPCGLCPASFHCAAVKNPPLAGQVRIGRKENGFAMKNHDKPDKAPETAKKTEPVGSDMAGRAYGYLLQIRDLDNQLMWTRSNVILIVQGALFAILASKFDVLAKDYRFVLVIICLFGFAISYCWWRLVKGSSFWVDLWQGKLKEIEHLVTGEIKIFRNSKQDKKMPLWKILVGRQPYVSTHKILKFVAFLSTFLWFLLLIYVLSSS